MNKDCPGYLACDLCSSGSKTKARGKSVGKVNSLADTMDVSSAGSVYTRPAAETLDLAITNNQVYLLLTPGVLPTAPSPHRSQTHTHLPR